MAPIPLTWRAIRCLTTSCRATITSTVPLGTDVGLLVVLVAVAASLCAAYDVLVYVLNYVYWTLCMTPFVSYADYYVVAIVLLSLCMFHHE